MQQLNFTLNPATEYIELLKLLQVMGIAQTGGHAKIMIENGELIVDGVQEFRKRNKLRKGAVVRCADIEITID